MQGDTCPTEWYVSNSHSVNLRVRLTSSDWLKVGFWIHGPVAADTSYSERLLFVGLPHVHSKDSVSLGRCPGWSECLLGVFAILLALLCCCLNLRHLQTSVTSRIMIPDFYWSVHPHLCYVLPLSQRSWYTPPRWDLLPASYAWNGREQFLTVHTFSPYLK